MTFENITVDEFNTADVEPKGIYFFKAGLPADRVEKFAEYENGEGVEGTEYEGIQLFLVANKQAIYDTNRALVEVKDITGVSINCTFKLGHPDRQKNAVAQLKSWWMVNFGEYPPNDGKTLDWEAILANLHNGDGAWGSINHFEAEENKIIAYVGNRFSKEPPNKGPKD